MTTTRWNPVSRRKLLQSTGVAAGSAALLGGAVGRPRRSFAQEATPVTITWWDYHTEGAQFEATENLIARYMEENPNITIDRTTIPFADLKTRLLQGASARQLPDIALIDNPDHQAFASLGVLADITEYVDAWGQAENYFDGPWASTMWQGRNYGLPNNSNCIVLWYNREALDTAGVEPPTNWTELREAAAALTEGSQYGLAVSAVRSEEGTFQWLPFLWMTGEDIATMDSEGGQEALQLWTDLVADGHMSRGILGWTQADVRSQFQNGLAAMMVNGPWQIPVLEEESPDLDWDVVVLPQGEESASILGGENFSVTIAAENLDETWALLEWIHEPMTFRDYLIAGGRLPSRQDLADDEFWTSDPVQQVFLDQLFVARPRAYGDQYPEISSAIQEAIQAAVSGQTDVETALSQAQETVNPLLPEGS